MPKTLVKNKQQFKIKTDKGFVDFCGISTMGIKPLIQLTFDDGTKVSVTDKHCFYSQIGEELLAKDIKPGDVLLGTVDKTVVDIDQIPPQQTFDVIESETHTYFVNDLLCHNCEFLSAEALLIDTIVLANMTHRIENTVRPVGTINNMVLWKEITPHTTYLVGVDPATGSGEDFSVINIYEFPSLVQVGEWRKNTMSTNDLYSTLKNILIFLENKGAKIYFSIERNGVGEGVISLYEADEKPPEYAEFISEEAKGKRGMMTTSRTKMKACIDLKELIERNNMTINSRIMLAELKSFIRSKGSYDHQAGSTSDCISASLIVVRLLQEIATYEQQAYEKLYANEFEQWNADDYDGYGDYDDKDQGDPIVF